MRIKVSELTGAALDWAVSVCEHNVGWEPQGQDRDYYSSKWEHGGPIIEREGITLYPEADVDGWISHKAWGKQGDYYGPTPLIAAMRCYVASKHNVDVDIPEGLL